MGFYNGVPITVVGSVQSTLMSRETRSRRRAEEEARASSSRVPRTTKTQPSRRRPQPDR